MDLFSRSGALFAMVIDRQSYRVFNFVVMDGDNIETVGPEILVVSDQSNDHLLMAFGFGRTQEWRPLTENRPGIIAAIRPLAGGVLS